MAGIPMTRPVLAPTTPKTPTPVPKRNIVISESPITSLPSHSASLPLVPQIVSLGLIPMALFCSRFDWKAASSGQPSTFSTPVNRSRDRLSGLRNNGTPASNGTSKRVVRKKSFWEKYVLYTKNSHVTKTQFRPQGFRHALSDMVQHHRVT